MGSVPVHTGLRLHYDILDLTDPWTKPETVFLHHGLGKSGRWWLPWARLLARDYRVVTVDMLGCGRSSRPRGHRWSVADHGENAVRVLDAIGVERVHFMGETVGGCVGLYMGARHGERLSSLAVAASPSRPPKDWLRQQSREIAANGLGPSIDRDLPSRLDWSRYPAAMYDWYRAQRLSASPRIVSEQYAAQAEEDLDWTLPLISAPTLLFIPDESPVDANLQMREMARIIPNARIADLPPGRKPVWFHYAEAEVCVDAYRAFLRTNSGQ